MARYHPFLQNWWVRVKRQAMAEGVGIVATWHPRMDGGRCWGALCRRRRAIAGAPISVAPYPALHCRIHPDGHAGQLRRGYVPYRRRGGHRDAQLMALGAMVTFQVLRGCVIDDGVPSQTI